jgi:hypothetical protein
VRRRLRLNAPRDPKTGEIRRKLWLWLIPIIVLLILIQFAVEPLLNGVWVSALPFLAEPSSFALGTLLESPEARAQFVGAWWFLGLFLLMGLFNTVLGE